MFLRIDQPSKQHLIENGIRMQCKTKNFVPIMNPVLSSSSSSGSRQFNLNDTFKLLRQESNHPTFFFKLVYLRFEHVKIWKGQIAIQRRGQVHMLNEQNGATRCIPIFRMAARIQKKISWMTEFLIAETHTSVLLLNYL